MLHQIHIPRYPLNEFIEVFVYFKGVQHEHNVDRFLPNGDVEILIDFHDRPQFIYDNNSLKEIQACNRVWASGLRTEPITIPSGTDSEMMVISFKKGRASSFFPFPMNEIKDSVVDADLVWGRDLGSLREQLLEIDDFAERFRVVEDFLLSEFRSQLDLDPCVAFAVTEMSERPDAISISRMNHQIGYSQKHFIDMFKRSVGVTPKAYLKIMRFQKAVSTIDAATEHDWRTIALDCGFYDQSHFINDFKHFSGFTPEQYSKIHTNYQNYIPVG
ncbi:MAG TPA: AraC family transcriptional regulator [Pyrinomonadaceae bacterium]|nr:AraC family transcriptional regulator [Pyrinomonadaceae bacterium]